MEFRSAATFFLFFLLFFLIFKKTSKFSCQKNTKVIRFFGKSNFLVFLPKKKLAPRARSRITWIEDELDNEKQNFGERREGGGEKRNIER